MSDNNNDFIEVYENVFSKEYCDNVIACMEKSFSLGYGATRQQADDGLKTEKDDNQIFPWMQLSSEFAMPDDVHREFTGKFWSTCYPHYAGKYAALEHTDAHTIYGNKLQKTPVGGGYHVWHHEHCRRDNNRILAYIVYLNDVEEGGETEFLYQHKRVKPKQGTLVIFPAGFTHTHRGNPPLSNTKYIMTGWVEY